MTAYIQIYVSSLLPSLSKSSIKVGLIVCVIVSTFFREEKKKNQIHGV